VIDERPQGWGVGAPFAWLAAPVYGCRMGDPHVERAREKIAAEFGPQLDQCETLRAFAADLTERWTGRPLETTADALIVALCARSYGTYCSSVSEASDGWGPSSMMLNRSLFEDMVDAHWVHADPEAATTRYQQHDQHRRILLSDVARKHYPGLDVPVVDEELRRELQGVFGRYGEKSWTGLNLHERVKLIEDQWRTPAVPEEGVKALHFFRDVAHRENSDTLHVSARSLNAVVAAHEPDVMTFRIGPHVEDTSRALFGAFWPFTQTVTLLIDHFGLKVDPAEREGVVTPTVFDRERKEADESAT
jgi:hypothetical protein